jgi:hypothetical protein
MELIHLSEKVNALELLVPRLVICHPWDHILRDELVEVCLEKMIFREIL